MKKNPFTKKQSELVVSCPQCLDDDVEITSTSETTSWTAKGSVTVKYDHYKCNSCGNSWRRPQPK